MRNRLFYLCSLMLTLGFTQSLRAQNETFAYKDWEKNNKLTVEDFKGTPDANSPSISSVAMEISPYELSISDDSVTFLVVVRLDKFGSWAKVKDSPEKFLNYEQKVFDIEEVYARMIRKQMTRERFTHENRGNILDTLSSKYEDHLCYDEIREYGTESNGGTDSTVAKNWSTKIQRELDSLQAYSDPIVRIKFFKEH